jgi:uncharacterized repeat protein (TIGR03806 family)
VVNKVVLILGICLTISIVAIGEMAAVSVDVEAKKPAKFLSAFNFLLVEDGKLTTKPNVGVEPFDVITPLFSDYTEKYRYVWMPGGVSAEYHDQDVFDFPVGTVMIKTFSYLKDVRDPSLGERVLETRLLIHNSKGWKGWVYLWNEDQSDAVLKIAGTTVDAEWIDAAGKRMTNNYIVPNVNQCKGCHEQDEKLMPIGPKARYLNMDYEFPGGVQNQLLRLAEVGYLNGLPADMATIDAVVAWDNESAPLDRRARAWLEMNCMHCHNAVGPASTTGFVLDYYEESPIKLGVMKPPVAAGRGSGGLLFDIVPGKPDESILLFRINSTDPGIMMPELPRRMVHKESSKLIRQWIEAMEMAEDIGENK